MMPRSPQGEGRTLFQEVVASQCAGVLARFGLVPQSSFPEIVCFASSEVFVEVFHDSMSLEVGINIGLQSHPSASVPRSIERTVMSIGRPTSPYAFSLEQIVKYGCADVDRDVLIGSFVGTDPSVLGGGLARLMDTATRCAGPLLRGDRSSYDLLRKKVSDAAEVFTAQIQLEDLRSDVNRAWATRDYASVVRVLEELGDSRSLADEAKLVYARKRLAAE